MITQVTLSHFRHMTGQRYDALGRINLLLGPNGAGKTNILEAISLLSPGKGLRHAAPTQWRQHGAPANAPWAVHAHIDIGYDDVTVATGSPPQDAQAAKRIVAIDGVVQSSQQNLADMLAVVWLTPQMDGLFLADTSERRRFFDRLIYALHPDHAKYLARYDHGLRQRNKLLKDRQRDAFWYHALHQIMAPAAVAIAAARLDMMAQINRWIDETSLRLPLPLLAVDGFAEDLLKTRSAAQAEQMLLETWQKSLSDDLSHGATQIGPHRSDFSGFYRAKNIPAQLCSTGEQKALLLGLVLAHAHGVKQQKPDRPLIVLLDDIAAHFDVDRRQDLYDFLPQTGAQIFISGTDADDFTGLIDTSGLQILSPTMVTA